MPIKSVKVKDMSAVDCDLKAMLAKHGLKSTKQRIAVLSVLQLNADPLTAEEIYIRLHDSAEECGNISLSTVYRVLDILGKSGLVSKDGLIDGGKALYELVTGMHRHNLICIKCHKTIPIEECCPISGLEKRLEDTTGYEISGHKLEIYGICPKCRCLC